MPDCHAYSLNSPLVLTNGRYSNELLYIYRQFAGFKAVWVSDW